MPNYIKVLVFPQNGVQFQFLVNKDSTRSLKMNATIGLVLFWFKDTVIQPSETAVNYLNKSELQAAYKIFKTANYIDKNNIIRTF